MNIRLFNTSQIIQFKENFKLIPWAFCMQQNDVYPLRLKNIQYNVCLHIVVILDATISFVIKLKIQENSLFWSFILTVNWVTETAPKLPFLI